MTADFLKLNVYKVFLNQVLNAKKYQYEDLTDHTASTYNQWYVVFSLKQNINPKVQDDMTVLVSNIWVQGKILYADENNLLLDDETGIAFVTGLSKLPQSSRNFETNSYVMVVGYISNVGPFSIPKHMANCYLQSDVTINANLRALKVTNLSNNINCRSGVWWKKEVLQAQTEVLLSRFK